jgi:hypothetical protein
VGSGDVECVDVEDEDLSPGEFVEPGENDEEL